MSEEQDEPRQLTVAELLARHGRSLPEDSEPRRRAAEADADEDDGSLDHGVDEAIADVEYVETGPLDEQTAEHEIASDGVSSSRVRRIRDASRRRRDVRDRRREGPDERAHRTAYQRHPALRALVILGVVLVMLACYYTAVLLIAQGSIDRVDVQRPSSAVVIDAAAQEGATASLIVVADSGEGRDHGGQITALAYEAPDASSLTIVSFPSNLLVDLPPCGTGSDPVEPTVTTVETAFALGGAKCSVAAIEAMTGIGIDHYIGFDLAYFPDLIDAVGGVGVCLSAPLADPSLGLDLPAGESELDGTTATNYVRAVNGGAGDDPGRAARQVDFLSRLFEKVVDIKTLANPVAVTRFAFASAEALELDPDTSLGDLRKIGSSLGGSSSTEVSIVVPPLSPDVQELPGTDIEVQRLDPVLARTMLDAVISGEPVESAPQESRDPSTPAGGDQPADAASPPPTPAAMPVNC